MATTSMVPFGQGERPSQARQPHIYQIDFTAVASGKRVASTKRRVRWRFGFANPEALANGETGTACRGEEHDITLVWSIASGKRLVLADGQEVHYSSNRGNLFDYSWTMRGNHVLKIVAHAAPPLSATPGFRQYDFFVDGQSFFSFPKVFRLGLAPGSQPVPAHLMGAITGGGGGGYASDPYRRSSSTDLARLEAPNNPDEEEAYLREAIKNSLQENAPQENGGPAPAPAVSERGQQLLLDFLDGDTSSAAAPAAAPLALPAPAGAFGGAFNAPPAPAPAPFGAPAQGYGAPSPQLPYGAPAPAGYPGAAPSQPAYGAAPPPSAAAMGALVPAAPAAPYGAARYAAPGSNFGGHPPAAPTPAAPNPFAAAPQPAAAPPTATTDPWGAPAPVGPQPVAAATPFAPAATPVTNGVAPSFASPPPQPTPSSLGFGSPQDAAGLNSFVSPEQPQVPPAGAPANPFTDPGFGTAAEPAAAVPNAFAPAAPEPAAAFGAAPVPGPAAPFAQAPEPTAPFAPAPEPAPAPVNAADAAYAKLANLGEFDLVSKKDQARSNPFEQSALSAPIGGTLSLADMKAKKSGEPKKEIMRSAAPAQGAMVVSQQQQGNNWGAQAGYIGAPQKPTYAQQPQAAYGQPQQPGAFGQQSAQPFGQPPPQQAPPPVNQNPFGAQQQPAYGQAPYQPGF